MLCSHSKNYKATLAFGVKITYGTILPSYPMIGGETPGTVINIGVSAIVFIKSRVRVVSWSHIVSMGKLRGPRLASMIGDCLRQVSSVVYSFRIFLACSRASRDNTD